MFFRESDDSPRGLARFKLRSAGAFPRAEATLTHGERGRTKGSAAFEKAMQVLARMEQASTERRIRLKYPRRAHRIRAQGREAAPAPRPHRASWQAAVAPNVVTFNSLCTIIARAAAAGSRPP